MQDDEKTGDENQSEASEPGTTNMENAAPTPEQPDLQPAQPKRSRLYWSGLAWGAIPLVILLLAGGAMRLPYPGGNYGVYVFLIGLLAYIALLVTALVYLARRNKRFVGYGLLTMVLITPVVAVYGCTVISQIH